MYLKYSIKKALLLALAWTIIIFILCCTPGKYVPSTDWLELISFDKFVHASIFFILCSLWFVYFIKLNRINNLIIGLILTACITYGGILEIMQATLFSQRSGDWFDFIANSTGCFLSWLLFKKKQLFFYRNNN